VQGKQEMALSDRMTWAGYRLLAIRRRLIMLCARWVLLLLLCLSLVPSVHAENCAVGHHSVQLAKNAVVLRDFNCQIGPDASFAELRVTFFRVSEVVAGSLLKKPLPYMDQIVGPITFINNEVYKEIRNLFDTFGSSLHDSGGPTYFEFSGESVTRVRLPEVWTTGPDNQVHYLSRLFGGIGSDAVLLRSPSEVILNTDHWPTTGDAGYKMSYGCTWEQHPPIGCTTVWKYINVTDFNWILADLRTAIRRARQYVQARNSEEDDVPRIDEIDMHGQRLEKNFELYRYISRGNLPPNFLFVSTGPNIAGCYKINWVAEYSAKPLSFDFAVIENLSRQPITIDGFLGEASAVENLRPRVANSIPSGPRPMPLDVAPTTLQPGARAGLALRIIFGSEHPTWTERDPTPEQLYENIRSRRSRQFSMSIGGFNRYKVVTKSKESFQKPSAPDLSDYLYGPEIGLAGFSVDGQSFLLGGGEINTVEALSSEDEPFPDRSVLRTFNLSLGKIRPPGGFCCESDRCARP
jgi:hypothetical protein